jgi:hypothetical protein
MSTFYARAARSFTEAPALRKSRSTGEDDHRHECQQHGTGHRTRQAPGLDAHEEKDCDNRPTHPSSASTGGTQATSRWPTSRSRRPCILSSTETNYQGGGEQQAQQIPHHGIGPRTMRIERTDEERHCEPIWDSPRRELTAMATIKTTPSGV